MENVKSEIAYLEGVVRLLDETSLARLDFDELRARLTGVCASLESHGQSAGNHALLRQDYEQRIAGMIKAVAAVDRKRDRWEEAAASVDELPTLTAGELIERYRRVAARFRDCFPGSFGTQNWGGRRTVSPAR